MDKGRKRVKKPPKPNLTKSQNTSVFAKIKQWLPPAHFTSAASVSTSTIVKTETFSHTLFTQGITSIAEEVHCKNHSWLQPKRHVLIPWKKCPKEENAEQVK